MVYSVLYEDENLLIVNKSSGVLVHKTKFEEENLIDLINEKEGKDYFLAHRIDKYTSGALIVAKNQEYLKLLQDLFSKNQILKCYLALITKELPAKKLKITLSLGRSKNNKLMFSNRNAKNYKSAVTEVETLKGTFVEIFIKTGRTHQIRAHLCDIGCPILNDPIYSKDSFDKEFGQYLHSYKLSFICPIKNFPIEVCAPLPEKFVDKLEELNIHLCKET